MKGIIALLVLFATSTALGLNFNSDSGSGGSGTTARDFYFDAAALQALEIDFAPLTKLTGNTSAYFRAFDDTTEQSVNGKVLVPSYMASAGDITITAKVAAASTSSSDFVGLILYHNPVAAAGNFDIISPYLESNSAITSIANSTATLTSVSWTMSISSSTWAAGDTVFFRIARNVGVSGDMTGDLNLADLLIQTP